MAKLKDLIKTGFGLGVGVTASQILFLLIGVILLVVGTRLLEKARKGQGSYAFAYFILILGVVFGLGLGLGFLLENVMNNS